MIMMQFVTFCVAFLCWVSHGNGDYPAQGPHCGTLTCPEFNYCNLHTSSCEPCSRICSDDHNFDLEQCLQKCQVYLFDQRYYKKQDDTANTLSMITGLQLKFNVVLGLLLIVILVLIVISTVFFLVLRQQNNLSLATIRAIFKKRENKSNGVSKKGNKMADETDKKADLKIQIPVSTFQSESPTTVTTGISRIPAEDSIDYAYDNPAMSNSPKTVSSS